MSYLGTLTRFPGQRVSEPPVALAGHARPGAADAAVPAVILLSRAADAELDGVRGLLDRAGVPSVRIDADDLATPDILVDMAASRVRVDGRWLAPTVTWERHFAGRSMEVPGSLARALFARDSWQALAEQLSAVSGTGIGGASFGRISQLRLAERHHIAVPRTLITTDLAQAAGRFPSGQLVVKALDQHFVEPAPGRIHWVLPAVVDRVAVPGATRPGPPVIVQEYVEHEAELRVYYVRGELHGFDVRKDAPADLWRAPDRIVVRCRDVPPLVASAARLLAVAMGLRYAAFDFLLRSDGTPVFLEANPDGDWRWIERRIGAAPVTADVASMLCRLHRDNTGTGSRADRFSLLSFLAGSPRPGLP